MDAIANKEQLAKLRNLVRSIPLGWWVYGRYWALRSWFEARQQYDADHAVEFFGEFPEPTLDSPVSQLCTQTQLQSARYRYWCTQMRCIARFSRKQWEFAYILEVLDQAGLLVPGKTGIGFGCGREPLVGLLANFGCELTATDLDADRAMAQGWANTMQHSSSLNALYDCAREYIARDDFYSRVSYRTVDMNAIPEDFAGQADFVWSACALEHLGSLQHGLDFIRNSLQCLRPGGVAVHTTEFNLSSKTTTLESPACSIYRESDIRSLIQELEAEGYEVAPLNLCTGNGPVDRHVDLPPYNMSPHLKLMLEGYVVTSVGLTVRKPVSTLVTEQATS